MNAPAPLDWSDIDTAAGRILFDAAGTARSIREAPSASAVDFWQGELTGLIRAIALLIDAPLYSGTRYGLVAGTAVWAELFAAVRHIVEFPDTGRTLCAFNMSALTAEWPTRRESLLAAKRS